MFRAVACREAACYLQRDLPGNIRKVFRFCYQPDSCLQSFLVYKRPVSRCCGRTLCKDHPRTGPRWLAEILRQSPRIHWCSLQKWSLNRRFLLWVLVRAEATLWYSCKVTPGKPGDQRNATGKRVVLEMDEHNRARESSRRCSSPTEFLIYLGSISFNNSSARCCSAISSLVLNVTITSRFAECASNRFSRLSRSPRFAPPTLRSVFRTEMESGRWWLSSFHARMTIFLTMVNPRLSTSAIKTGRAFSSRTSLL